MKQLHYIILLTLLALASCARPSAELSSYDVMVYEPTYASGFEIVGSEGGESTILVTKTPWQGADSTASTRLFIARNGESAPAGFEGQVLRGDARRVICMSSSYVAMLDAVDAVDHVVGVSGLDFITNPKILAGRDTIGDVGYDNNINFELLLSLRPDVVLLYGVNGANVVEAKLRETGIPYAYIGEYLEESPLGKAEWLVAISEIIGRRDRGEEVFAEIPVRYLTLRDSAARLPEKPVVMVNTPYADSWVMPSMSSYAVRLITDAGGRIAYDKNLSNRSIPIDIEEAYLLTDGADLWINVSQIYKLDEIRTKFPKFAETKPVRRGDVWNTMRHVTPNGGNDYWETGVVYPDRVLQDLVMIFHPQLMDEEKLSYYKRLE